MAINPEFEFEPDTGPETDPLVHRERPWTKMDKLLLTFGVVVNLGDGVEIYLPGSFNTKNYISLSISIAGFDHCTLLMD